MNGLPVRLQPEIGGPMVHIEDYAYG